MTKHINDIENLAKIRSDLQSRGKRIVRYEDVERNVNSLLNGRSKLTPTILSDLNDLIEGVVLDSCIEMNLTEEQMNYCSPLTETLLELSDYTLDVNLDADFGADDIIDPMIIQFGIECMQKCIRTFQQWEISNSYAVTCPPKTDPDFKLELC